MTYDISDNTGRLDHTLAELIPELSRSKLKQLILDGSVTVDQNIIKKPSYNIDKSLHLNVEMKLDTSKPSLIPKKMPLDIVYEDSSVIVINKTRGIVVHSGEHKEEDTLVSGVLAHCGTLANSGNPLRPGVVHRLDRYTEGLVMFAKTIGALENLKQQFYSRSVTKKYYAMVKGELKEDDYRIESMIGRHRIHRHKQTSLSPVLGTEKEAITQIKVIKRFNTKTFCDIQIFTGRTHQIRVHCADMGHPVIGDNVYDSQCGKKYDGQLLQAYYLSFKNPESLKEMTLQLEPSSFFSA